MTIDYCKSWKSESDIVPLAILLNSLMCDIIKLCPSTDIPSGTTFMLKR